jgi:hypothetical protein
MIITENINCQEVVYIEYIIELKKGVQTLIIGYISIMDEDELNVYGVHSKNSIMICLLPIKVI